MKDVLALAMTHSLQRCKAVMACGSQRLQERQFFGTILFFLVSEHGTWVVT